MSKKYDLVVKTGEYQSGGQSKTRWKTIGALMDDGKGGMYGFIDRHFNPAGIPFKEGSESIMVSLFEPKTKGEQQEPKKSEPAEEIPFQEIKMELIKYLDLIS